MDKSKKQEILEAKAHALSTLKEHFKPGMTVHTILRYVARSGMSRHVSVCIFDQKDKRALYFHWHIAKVCNYKLVSGFFDAIKVEGCGFDVGFDIVYNLGHVLFPEGYGCIGKNCPSNDHSNGDRDYTKHTKKKPHWHREGGYAFRHAWL